MRKQMIQDWVDTINKTIEALIAFRDTLGQAADQDPSDVDALGLDRLSNAAYKHVFDMAEALTVADFYEFMDTVIGRNSVYYIVKNTILERRVRRPIVEMFIRSIRETDPVAADELQALLDETWERDL